MEPVFNSETNVVTIPRHPGVRYLVDGKKVTGDIVVQKETVVTAEAVPPAKLKDGITTTWTFFPVTSKSESFLDHSS